MLFGESVVGIQCRDFVIGQSIALSTKVEIEGGFCRRAEVKLEVDKLAPLACFSMTRKVRGIKCDVVADPIPAWEALLRLRRGVKAVPMR